MNINQLNKAKHWWRNELSLNQQKEFALKHLLNFEYNALLGNTAKYASLNYWNKLILIIWKKEIKQF